MLLRLFAFFLLCLGLVSGSSWPVLQVGQAGPNVESLQLLLAQVGLLIGNVDGDFGPQTESSVKNFQTQKGLAVTGVVDEKTWTLLCPLLVNGSQGKAVTSLQVQLNKHLYNVGEDGMFGPATYNAVVSFQGYAGLAQDGMVGNDTWRELLGKDPRSMTVGDAVYASCSTGIVRGLSDQLVGTLNQCLHPGLMVDFSSTPNVNIGSSVYTFMQKPAEAAFRKAMTASTRVLTMNSAFRSLDQQLLLYQWYLQGRCGIMLAAKPGTSNHESGLAFDCNDGSSWNSYFASYSFKWLGSQDPPHFDYVGSGAIEMRPSSTKAFQMLWNKNNPHDMIQVDGMYGPDTENRLLKSPANGFSIASGC